MSNQKRLSVFCSADYRRLPSASELHSSSILVFASSRSCLCPPSCVAICSPIIHSLQFILHQPFPKSQPKHSSSRTKHLLYAVLTYSHAFSYLHASNLPSLYHCNVYVLTFSLIETASIVIGHSHPSVINPRHN